MTELFELFATCPKGLESLLAEELKDLGMVDVKQKLAGVQFYADHTAAYKVCLWSRLANRILMPIKTVNADTIEELYQQSVNIPWENHLDPEGSLWIDFVGQNHAVRNTQFGAQKIKDAIVDRMRRKFNTRPSIERTLPDITINVRLHKNEATLHIDLSGESLHRRGYRAHQMVAPLKENLAAALLIRAGWQKNWTQLDALLDPMCGSGTLLIEAALMATDCAPGLFRQRFGFEKWKQFDTESWVELKRQAEQRFDAGLQQTLPEIRGYDESIGAIKAAEQNIADAGLENVVRVILKPVTQFKRPTHTNLTNGLIITNPPYGERLGEEEELVAVYQQLGRVFKSDFEGWTAAVFTSNQRLAKCIGLRSYKQYKFYNGTIPSELLLIDISEKNHFVEKTHADLAAMPANNQASLYGAGQAVSAHTLSAGAEMVANRLQKNQKALTPWLNRTGVSCYRIYDADLPEYAAAIDIYTAVGGEEFVHIQEYAAPKTIDEKKAEQRFQDLVKAAQSVFEVDSSHFSTKQRRRNRGKQQYEALTGQEAQSDRQFLVREGQAGFWVDLWSYLDTGLFLDHRLVREKIAEISLGKKFLNLFCYTATATVHAAIGGAASSTSVDMSKTYLSWAERNFAENRLSDRHQLVQADCLDWLRQCRTAFDVIMLDPPSFSNSKRMDGVLDVQRDHTSMIARCMELLNPGGTLVFSTNLRNFKLDWEALSHWHIEDFTKPSIDKDFQRNPKIHQCYLISQK